MMTSLAETIALLTNPTPKVLDPEDDVNIETAAKANEFVNEDDETVYAVSELRSKTAPLLEDIDPTYSGKKVARKSLNVIFNIDESTYSKNIENLELSDESVSFYSSDNNGELSDDAIEFRSSIQKGYSSCDDIDQEDKQESDKSNDSDELENNEEMAHKFSSIDVSSEMDKGIAVKAQQELWNRLCECRIKLQKLLLLSNKLPQSNCLKLLKVNGGKEISEHINKGSNSIKVFLNSCFDLQEEFLKQDSEISNFKNNENQDISNPDDEEIPSDTDEEINVSEKSEIKQHTRKRNTKRKLACEEYAEILAKHHKSLIPYRNFVIQKWDEKTKLSSGYITQKSFSSFETSAVKQIEQILQDKNRLLKRTQLKRSLYKVIGKPDIFHIRSEGNSDENEKISKQDMFLGDYDSEIFDDDDFYRQLLKDVIESKSLGIDPSILKKQIEIQSIRNRMKRKVDTKASKGRKIRYDVHPKLVNFMAPVETSTISDEARDNLLKCLFGRSLVKNS